MKSRKKRGFNLLKRLIVFNCELNMQLLIKHILNNLLMKNFTISYQITFVYEDQNENISRLIDISINSKNLHSLQKILHEQTVEEDVERNENAKTKVVDIHSEYFLIVDHKGKQVWKDWSFKEN
jgi:hypothetical protein